MTKRAASAAPAGSEVKQAKATSSAGGASSAAGSPAAAAPAASSADAAWPQVLSGRVTKPTLPKEDEDVLARTVMKDVIPWVVQELPEFLHASGHYPDKGVCPTALPPLEIRLEKQSNKRMVSFKEPWVQANVVESIEQSKMYEAGGNALWLNPEHQAKSYKVPNPEVSWSWVLNGAKSHFKEFDGGSMGKRIKFPIDLGGLWDKDVKVLDKQYPCGAVPLGAHGFIYGLYVALFLAMDDKNTTKAAMLLESALTCTITLYAELSVGEVALRAMHYSEIVRHSQQVLVDSFVTFSMKVHTMEGKLDVETLKRKDVRFNGHNVNQTMLKAINHIKNLSEEAWGLMGMIDRQFGHELLTGNYNKMLRLMQATSPKRGATMDDMLVWSLQTMLVLMQRGETEESDFKTENFIKQRDGTPSWIATCCVQRTFLQYVLTVIENSRQIDAQLADKLTVRVMQHFANPMKYHETCPPNKDEDMELVDAPGEQGGRAWTPRVTWRTWKRSCPRRVRCWLNCAGRSSMARTTRSSSTLPTRRLKCLTRLCKPRLSHLVTLARISTRW